MTEFAKPNFGPGADFDTSPADLSAVDQFDTLITLVNKTRGDVYGHPLDDFEKVRQMAPQIDGCSDPHIKHVLYMILVKVARLVETPDHVDSLVDIAGYARTGCMIIDRKGQKDDGSEV